MLRSFLTRLANSVTRTVLLVLCLLLCLACATPFPTESLEEGMTAETVREEFGEPESIHPGGVRTLAAWGVELSWIYLHEELNLRWFIFPQSLLSIPILAAWPDVPWDGLYVTRSPVVLHFEKGKLARWEVFEPPDSRYAPDLGIPMFGNYIDDAHHGVGHTHHHGH